MTDYSKVHSAARKLTTANNVGAENTAEIAYREAFLRYKEEDDRDPSTPRLTNK